MEKEIQVRVDFLSDTAMKISGAVVAGTVGPILIFLCWYCKGKKEEFCGGRGASKYGL